MEVLKLFYRNKNYCSMFNLDAEELITINNVVWKKMYTADGHNYFINQENGELTWKLPTPPPSLPEEKEDENESDICDNSDSSSSIDSPINSPVKELENAFNILDMKSRQLCNSLWDEIPSENRLAFFQKANNNVNNNKRDKPDDIYWSLPTDSIEYKPTLLSNNNNNRNLEYPTYADSFPNLFTPIRIKQHQNINNRNNSLVYQQQNVEWISTPSPSIHPTLNFQYDHDNNYNENEYNNQYALPYQKNIVDSENEYNINRSITSKGPFLTILCGSLPFEFSTRCGHVIIRLGHSFFSCI